MWGSKPYDNDSAADWLGGLINKTKLRKRWLKGIKHDWEQEGQPEITRAAVWLFVQLGHVYVWPIGSYDKDLKLTLEKAQALLKSELVEVEGIEEQMKEAVIALKGRLK